ncbi:major facilitator superfamily domain-containing protein, partial [Leptodontidium sp. 2 PMI_412]
ETEYPTGIRFAILTVSLMLMVFMVALDTTIMATAIPAITTQFHSIADIGWYTGAYLLPVMALQPSFGKIYTFFSIKYVLLCALLLFETGSLISALSPSSSIFILGRVVSGIGAAAIFGGGMVLISLAVPIHRVALYMSIMSSMYGAAGLTGPPIGGLFTSSSRLTWRFCFYINLPFGGISVLLMLFAFREPKREKMKLSIKEKVKKMDLAGTTLFISSMVCLSLALQWGRNSIPWSDPKAWGLMLGFGLLLIAFVALQFKLGENATIPPRVFSARSIILAQLIAILLSIGTNIHTFYLAFYFQSAKGLSASASGIRSLPYLLSVTFTELFVGAGVSWTGIYNPFMIIGTAIYIVGCALLCTLQVDTGEGYLIGYQILAGVGFGSTLALCATVLRVNVSDEHIHVAGVLASFAPMFGATLAASLGQNIFRSSLVDKLLQSVSPELVVQIADAGARGGGAVVADDMKGVVLEAYNYAVKRTFLVSAVVSGIAFVCTLGLKWKKIDKK